MARKSSLIVTAGAALAALALTLLLGLASASAHQGTISVTLTDHRADPDRPPVMRVHDAVSIDGRATAVAAGSSVVMQVRNLGGRWRGVARGPVGSGGGIHLIWRIGPRAKGNIQWRVIIRNSGRTVGGTAPASLTVGPAFIACKMPAVNTPAGEGAVVGGLYLYGGGHPGVDRCSTTSYTADLVDDSGNVVASQKVAAGSGFVLVAKPGSYVVESSKCTGPRATVRAAEATRKSVFCPIG